MSTELIKITETSGLEKPKAQHILEQFEGFFKEAEKWRDEARAIVITDVSQKKEMKKARETRLALKDIRVNAEKARVRLKEQSLREGKAIDGIANVIKAVIVPVEQYLEDQEKFAERKEEQRKEKLFQERISRLSQYVPDISLYNIKEMSDEVFEKLLETSRISHEAVIESQKKAEAERLEREAAERKEQERIKLENESLKKEAGERERALEKERAKAAEEKRFAEEQARKERAAREKAESELRAKQEAEERTRKEAEERERKQKEAEEEALRQAKLAPEKDKLFAFSERIRSVESPEGLSKAGQEIVKIAEQKLLAISQEIKESLKNL